MFKNFTIHLDYQKGKIQQLDIPVQGILSNKAGYIARYEGITLIGIQIFKTHITTLQIGSTNNNKMLKQLIEGSESTS